MVFCLFILMTVWICFKQSGSKNYVDKYIFQAIVRKLCFCLGRWWGGGSLTQISTLIFRPNVVTLTALGICNKRNTWVAKVNLKGHKQFFSFALLSTLTMARAAQISTYMSSAKYIIERGFLSQLEVSVAIIIKSTV